MVEGGKGGQRASRLTPDACATFSESLRILYENHQLPTSIEYVQALTR